jgi:hydroxymethylglutaryl-CoA reductase
LKFTNIIALSTLIHCIISEIVSETSRYAKLKVVGHSIGGNSVIVAFEYRTGDAAG